MSLPTVWFLLIGILFTGYFTLEGFDFGVGILMPLLGQGSDTRRRVALNTIGPVWDGNEVWLITAAGALFAAFPEWYATMFSGFYLPLLVILVSLILRVVAIEWRGKIDDPRWRARCDLGIGIGSWVPAFGWGLAFANIVRGVKLDADHNIVGSVADLVNPYALLGGVAVLLLFVLHGAIFLTLKTADEFRDSARRAVRSVIVPAATLLLAFVVWTQLAHGKPWTWAAVGVVVAGLASAALANRTGRDGWAFLGTTITVPALVVLFFGSMYPNVVASTIAPADSLTIANASSTHYTLVVMTWAAVIMTPVVLGYQGWTYWVFRNRISIRHIPPGIGLGCSETR